MITKERELEILRNTAVLCRVKVQDKLLEVKACREGFNHSDCEKTCYFGKETLSELKQCRYITACLSGMRPDKTCVYFEEVNKPIKRKQR